MPYRIRRSDCGGCNAPLNLGSICNLGPTGSRSPTGITGPTNAVAPVQRERRRLRVQQVQSH